MTHIEPREVTIRVPSFEMEGIIKGGLDSFEFESSSTHFLHWFPEGGIDSLTIDRRKLKREQLEIVEACEKKIKELLGFG